MAANLLPIIAIAGAAYFLMKKKDAPATNGKPTGNGKPTESSPQTDEKDVSDIKEPGLYDMKVGETVTIIPPGVSFYGTGYIELDGEGAGQFADEAYILVGNLANVDSAHQVDSITFRPIKKGIFKLLLDSWSGDGEWVHSNTDDVEYTFQVT